MYYSHNCISTCARISPLTVKYGESHEVNQNTLLKLYTREPIKFMLGLHWFMSQLNRWLI